VLYRRTFSYLGGHGMDKTEGAKEKRGPLEVFEKVWSQALVAVSTAEDEAAKVGARMAEAAGWSPDELKRQVRELTLRLSHQRRSLETGVEDGVKGALAKLRVPRRDDLAGITSRLDAVSRRIDALEKGR
jgi:polyhydroxyalkanoate synthesis regulator phasin